MNYDTLDSMIMDMVVHDIIRPSPLLSLLTKKKYKLIDEYLPGEIGGMRTVRVNMNGTLGVSDGEYLYREPQPLHPPLSEQNKKQGAD